MANNINQKHQKNKKQVKPKTIKNKRTKKVFYVPLIKFDSLVKVELVGRNPCVTAPSHGGMWKTEFIR